MCVEGGAWDKRERERERERERGRERGEEGWGNFSQRDGVLCMYVQVMTLLCVGAGDQGSMG